MSVYLPIASSALRLYPRLSLLCSDSWLVEVGSDGSWLAPQSSCAYVCPQGLVC